MSHFAKLCAVSLSSFVLACSSSKPTVAAPEPSAAADAGALAAAEPAPPLPSADATGRIETLFVRDQLGTCEGEGTRQCLQVRGAASEPWRNFFASIAGFEYEPAHEYELRVEVTPVEGAPADAPSLRYRLVEVVSKRKTGS